MTLSWPLITFASPFEMTDLCRAVDGLNGGLDILRVHVDDERTGLSEWGPLPSSWLRLRGLMVMNTVEVTGMWSRYCRDTIPPSSSRKKQPFVLACSQTCNTWNLN
ncbi:hypothetical protein JZ751_024916 [Albula glossodonta]|uniref:Uncharacterized protein n=1 Tax=Albula glossodonta TaxID=121402 RepID=A0A8T2PMN0_9TELE|nr:hypothetical protein JZ751_024916 [Albula glossodonta]